MKQFIRPDFLKQGDTVAIVAMASSLTEKQRQMEWRPLFESWGLKIKTGRHLYDALPGEFAGTDADRAADIVEALLDPEVKAIISFRGGYGSIRTVCEMDTRLFAEHPKWIVGFSDITVFHAALRREGVESILGGMPGTFTGDCAASQQYLHDALFGIQTGHVSAPHPYSRQGEAVGRLVGGNLCLFHSLSGTEWGNLLEEPSILFIEDVDERMYNIDRMLMTLRTSGVLDRAKGIIIGQFTDTAGEDEWQRPVIDLVKEHMDRLEYPVLFGFPCGHEHPNFSLYMGREVRLNVTAEGGSLTYL